MILWIILSIISCVFVVISFLREGEKIHYLWIILPCVVAVTALISLIVSACAPKQYIPDEKIKFSQIVCDSIVITPSLDSHVDKTDYFHMEYKLRNNVATLSVEIPIYCCSFETSTKGFPYIEKYFCRRLSSTREYLYDSWCRPRYYYKIYLVPTE